MNNAFASFASADLTAGQLNAIVKKLGGYEAALKLLRGELVVKLADIPTFAPWKIIRIGGTAKAELQKRLKKEKFYLSDYAPDIMGKDAFKTLSEKEDVSLVRLSVAELGFKNPATYDEIVSRAKDLGLDLCPAEVGPHLRLNETDQPLGDYYWVAMEPIVFSYGHRHVFCVGRNDDGERWLSADFVAIDDRWNLAYRFVFLSRK